jgi:hypothetical protein
VAAVAAGGAVEKKIGSRGGAEARRFLSFQRFDRRSRDIVGSASPEARFNTIFSAPPRLRAKQFQHLEGAMLDGLEKHGRSIGAEALERVAASFGGERRGDAVIVRVRRDDARLRWLGRLWR